MLDRLGAAQVDSTISASRPCTRRTKTRSASLVTVCTSVSAPGRRAAQISTVSRIVRLRSFSRSLAGAVLTRPRIWLSACVRALTLELENPYPFDVPGLGLGSAQGLTGQHRAGGRDRIEGIGLPDPTTDLPVRSVDLEHRDTRPPGGSG